MSRLNPLYTKIIRWNEAVANEGFLNIAKLEERPAHPEMIEALSDPELLPVMTRELYGELCALVNPQALATYKLAKAIDELRAVLQNLK